MAETVYALCGLTALWCTALLLRGYRKSGSRLLLWSGICFAGLVLNNLLLFLDKVILPDYDLQVWRTASALIALIPLLYGMIWESE